MTTLREKIIAAIDESMFVTEDGEIGGSYGAADKILDLPEIKDALAHYQSRSIFDRKPLDL